MKKLDIAKLDARINHLQRRLFRASNELQRTIEQRKGLIRRQLPISTEPPVAMVTVNPAKPPGQQVTDVTEVTELTSAGGFGINLDDDLDVRSQPWARRNEADEKAKAEILAEAEERAKLKAKGGEARRKAQRSGETRRMPLQGKAALAALARQA